MLFEFGGVGRRGWRKGPGAELVVLTLQDAGPVAPRAEGNEELQSTNEELETTKEEMQSINEELQTINSEMAGKNEQLTKLGSDMFNLLESTEFATLFLDESLCIKRFTRGMNELFHLRDVPRQHLWHKIEVVMRKVR